MAGGPGLIQHIEEDVRGLCSGYTMLLVDGDSVYVPRYNGVVMVTGAVNSPLAVAYVPGEDINFYIRSAGGGNTHADLNRAYVTQPNGKVLTGDESNVSLHGNGGKTRTFAVPVTPSTVAFTQPACVVASEPAVN